MIIGGRDKLRQATSITRSCRDEEGTIVLRRTHQRFRTDRHRAKMSTVTFSRCRAMKRTAQTETACAEKCANLGDLDRQRPV